jgi:hypothetical protein
MHLIFTSPAPLSSPLSPHPPASTPGPGGRPPGHLLGPRIRLASPPTGRPNSRADPCRGQWRSAARERLPPAGLACKGSRPGNMRSKGAGGSAPERAPDASAPPHIPPVCSGHSPANTGVRNGSALLLRLSDTTPTYRRSPSGPAAYGPHLGKARGDPAELPRPGDKRPRPRPNP